MKLTEAQIVELYFEGELDVDGTKLTTVHEGSFEQDGKYQTADIIFTDGERYYMSYVVRSGSPFTDWNYVDYGDADVTEVEKREVTVTEWIEVRK